MYSNLFLKQINVGLTKCWHSTILIAISFCRCHDAVGHWTTVSHEKIFRIMRNIWNYTFKVESNKYKQESTLQKCKNCGMIWNFCFSDGVNFNRSSIFPLLLHTDFFWISLEPKNLTDPKGRWLLTLRQLLTFLWLWHVHYTHTRFRLN